MIFSSIVPVFRVEDYLLKCVQSIINQSYKDIEIILVDDGRDDRCPLMCEEDALFYMACHENNLKMFTFQAVIGDVYCEQSIWFKGYNEQYFYDTGSFLAEAYPLMKHLAKWYYPFRCRKITRLFVKQIIRCINNGILDTNVEKALKNIVVTNNAIMDGDDQIWV